MKRRTERSIIRGTLERARVVAKLQQAPAPVDVGRLVAKAAPAISAAITQTVGAVWAERIADLERQALRLAEGQRTAPPAFYGYVDPTTRAYVPLPDERGRDVGKAEAFANAAAALPGDDPRRSELGRAAALTELRQTRPWAPDDDGGSTR